jgi:hypothetical protein
MFDLLLFLFRFLMSITLADSENADPPIVPARERLRLSNEIREFIRPECGSCHTSSLPTAKPAALAIFDLAGDDWSAEMTKEEFGGLRSRARDINEILPLKVDSLAATRMIQEHPPEDP